MNRRRFLGLLGGAATAIVASPNIVRAQTLGLGGGTAPSNRLNVGFIGGGGISIGHITHVLQDSSLQLAMICEVDRSTLAMQREKISAHYAQRNGTASFNGLKVTSDFREVINDPSIDVIFNCTPDHWHALPVIHSARAGKHIYSEKPLSRTAAEGYAMVDAVQRSGIVCQIGSQQRSSPEFQRGISIVRNGLIGKVKRVQVGLPGNGGVTQLVSTQPQAVPAHLDYDMWVGPSPWIPYIAERHHFHWRWRYEFAGGQLTDWINHHYDIAQIMLDVSDEIPHTLTDVRGEFGLQAIYNTASFYSFKAHFTDDRIIEVSSAFPMGIRVEGENGWFHVTRGMMEHSSNSLRSMPTPSQGYAFQDGQIDHRQNFFDAIKNRRRPRSPIEQAHKTAMAAHLANAAIRTGRSTLKWDNDARQVVNADDAARLLAANYRAPWHLPA